MDREILQSCSLCWGWAAEECEKSSVQVNKKVQSVQAGGNVTFSCQSATKEDVIQVTWQKETDGTEDNIATYSVMNGQKIAKDYVSHVSFAHSELRASAISLHGVTLQDEGCYKCIFNTFPSGAVTDICLNTQTLFSANIFSLSGTQFGSDGLLTAVCSATGKPTPNITLTEAWRRHHVQNTNRTVTAASRLTFSANHLHALFCLLKHPQGRKMKALHLEKGREGRLQLCRDG
uniref:Ig-like domain-containing protein n=1 Tax=Zosterops lateralis melanops TaxID=1220523 RepID=A0A8D2QVN7_ZOSLA